MYSGSPRGETREVFFRAWRAHRTGQPLQGVEKLIVHVIQQHPEYHALLDRPEEALEKEFFPASGETNPFLHLGMHIAIEEQLSLDQPPGIRDLYRKLRQKSSDEHDTQHRVMECLGEMLWQAQHMNSPPDDKIYLNCLARLAGKPGSGA